MTSFNRGDVVVNVLGIAGVDGRLPRAGHSQVRRCHDEQQGVRLGNNVPHDDPHCLV